MHFDYITDKFVAGFRQVLDELCIQFIVGVPWATCQSNRGFYALEHVYFACDMLNRGNTLYQPFLCKGFQTSINDGLVQVGFSFEMLRFQRS